ncbi:hypothetical protein PPGU19_072030 (plasmid) [Paraburkholderia sp. PGU19]|uniref:hypothetical protein n=1 Tax=Paraburkholderia sp. PGU19 TaxID=2735434 RepID=UPI0015D9752E|nr:hypothetical protein [Paraburkholderia sp. PGU19]BCG02635.1 hypothetical protein PPGU19_072030 [Paraburkholderia sp. PGU19]
MLSPYPMSVLVDKVARKVEGFQFGQLPSHVIDGIALVAAATELLNAQSREELLQQLSDKADAIRRSASYRLHHQNYAYPEWHRITRSGTQVMAIGAPFHTAECKPVIVVFTYPNDLVNNPSMATQLFKDGKDCSLDQRLAEELAPLATKLFGSHGRLHVKGGTHYISPLHFLLCPVDTQRLAPQQVAAGFSALLADPDLEERYIEILAETKQMVEATRFKNVGLLARCLAFIQRKH